MKTQSDYKKTKMQVPRNGNQKELPTISKPCMLKHLWSAC